MIMMIRRHIRSIAGGAANVAPAVLCALCVLSILCVASGCHRRPLEDPSEKTLVKVKVNVKDIHNVTCDIYNPKLPLQQIAPTAMHVLFYDKATEVLAAETFITNIGTEDDGSRSLNGTISILPGNYRMLVYDFGTEATLIGGLENWESARAYTETVESAVRSRFNTKADEKGIDILQQPDHLVVASKESEQIPWHDELYTVKAEASSVVESWYLQIKVDGAQYISGAQAMLSGMVGANRIATNTRENEPEVGVWIPLQKSDDKGTPVICTVFNTFGRVPDSSNSLSVTFDIKTVDGKTLQKTFDISRLFLSENAIKHHWLLLEETIKINPPASSGGAFDPIVDGWDEEQREIEI